VSEHYAGRQIVGMDLHRRRSVLVRMTDIGEQLETVRISNDPQYLKAVMARAGEAPEVVLEAAYGWYWAADTLAELGATVHLAHPLGVKMFSYRRSRTTNVTPRIWPICCAWAACPKPGSPHPRPGSCAAGCGIGPSWSGCARA
jgi:hypothetical protein